MLQRERTSAIFDVSADLSWWTSCQGVGLTFRGEAMPLDSGEGAFDLDYTGRLNDWEWPPE
jgi:hypothetical protein